MTLAPEDTSCRVTVVQDRAHAVIRLAGELDFASMPLLAEALAGLLTSDGPTSILVEAQQLEFADVAGLRPLLDLAERMQPGSIKIAGARRRVARVFQLLDHQGLLT